MKFLILPLLYPLIVLGQSPEQTNRHRADSITSWFLGEQNFQRYAQLDLSHSRHSSANTDVFHYNFRHPKFDGKTFVVHFSLDASGHLIPDKDTRGLIRIDSTNDSTWIDAREAIHICREQAHRLRKKSLRLGWDSSAVSYDVYRKTSDFRDINPGEIVWLIDGEVLFRGERYSGTFEVNALNGRVTRRFAIPWD